LPKVKNATSYFKNGLKNWFRAIAIRADEHFPNELDNNSEIIYIGFVVV
jgi:hypothetical protein